MKIKININNGATERGLCFLNLFLCDRRIEKSLYFRSAASGHTAAVARAPAAAGVLVSARHRRRLTASRPPTSLPNAAPDATTVSSAATGALVRHARALSSAFSR